MITRTTTGRSRPGTMGRGARLIPLLVVLLATLVGGPEWTVPSATAVPAPDWPAMPTAPTPLTGAECGPPPTATPPVGQPPRAVNLGWYPNYPVAAIDGTKLHVALGDSYASGEGAPFTVDDRCGTPQPRYISGTAVEGNHCHRSLSAYPYQLWAILEEGDPSWRLDQRACSGATTRNFTAGQPNFFHLLGGGRDHTGPGNPAQLPAPVEADLVTITMSGNDLGFGGIVRDCLISLYVPWMGPACTPAREPLIAREIDGVWERYRAAFAQIDSPRIVMAGYPLPFPLDDRMPRSCGFGAGRTLGALEMRWLNSVAFRANAVLRAIAAEQGAAFVEVGDLLQAGDHTMCEEVAGPDPGERWINRFIPSSMEESAHPNAYLHRAEAERMADCLRTWDRPSARPYFCRIPPTGPTF